jgi:DNA replication protein DnaC
VEKKKALLICGRSGAGKTELARRIVDLVNKSDGQHQGIIIPVAEGVKMIAMMMGWDGEKDERGRRLLQELGSAGRHYWGEMWVIRTLAKFSSLSNAYDLLIVDDLRYQNEEDVFRTYFDDVTLIRVDREGEALIGNAVEHESEQWYKIATPDGVVINSGNLDDLHLAASGVVEMLFK